MVLCGKGDPERGTVSTKLLNDGVGLDDDDSPAEGFIFCLGRRELLEDDHKKIRDAPKFRQGTYRQTCFLNKPVDLEREPSI